MPELCAVLVLAWFSHGRSVQLPHICRTEEVTMELLNLKNVGEYGILGTILGVVIYILLKGQIRFVYPRDKKIRSALDRHRLK